MEASREENEERSSGKIMLKQICRGDPALGRKPESWPRTETSGGSFEKPLQNRVVKAID